MVVMLALGHECGLFRVMIGSSGQPTWVHGRQDLDSNALSDPSMVTSVAAMLFQVVECACAGRPGPVATRMLGAVGAGLHTHADQREPVLDTGSRGSRAYLPFPGPRSPLPGGGHSRWIGRDGDRGGWVLAGWVDRGNEWEVRPSRGSVKPLREPAASGFSVTFGGAEVFRRDSRSFEEPGRAAAPASGTACFASAEASRPV